MEASMSSVKLANINGYEGSVFPKSVLEDMIGISVSLNDGPDILIFPGGEHMIDQYNLTPNGAYLITKGSLTGACRNFGRMTAYNWLLDSKAFFGRNSWLLVSEPNWKYDA
jgi:hypothetical protein